MKALVVYESIFGNTLEIAKAIAVGLGSCEGIMVDLVEVGHAPASVEGFDLLVVGGPIHAWGMTRPGTRSGAKDQAVRAHKQPISTRIGVREWLKSLVPTAETHAAAAFDTALKTRWFPVGSAAKGESAGLRRAGYQIVAPPEHFLVEAVAGPVASGEIERARAWGTSLARAVVGQASVETGSVTSPAHAQ